MKPSCTSQFQLRPGPPPRATAGIFPPCQSLGWGICKFCTARGPGICQPGAISELFTRTQFPIRIWLHRRIYWKKKQIGSPVKDRNKLKRVVKVCSRFYACTSSLLLKPELHSENRSYRCESTCFGYWIKFLLILFEEHLFTFIKLFITYCYSPLLILMSMILYQY